VIIRNPYFMKISSIFHIFDFMKQLISFSIFLILALTICSCENTTSRSVIFDTDWWTDVDDACAIRILKGAAEEGIFDVKGICLSSVRPTSVPSVSAFLDHEGMAGIPIGADKEAVDFKGSPCYHDLVIESHTGDSLPGIDDIDDCVSFYRKLLSASREKVDIISVGFSTALARLLESGPDEFSRLDGRRLVARKVSHLWMMAGKYPSGSEHNFNLNPMTRKAGRIICEQWPTDITFLGFEVGVDVLAGAGLPEADLLRQILVSHANIDGRSAWDPMTVQLAATVNCKSPDIKEQYRNAGYEAVFGTVQLNEEDGSNTFVESTSGKHCYVKRLHEKEWYSTMLNDILLSHSPAHLTTKMTPR